MVGSISVGRNRNVRCRSSRSLYSEEKESAGRRMWRGFVHRRRGCEVAMSETRRLLHFVMNVNHFRRKYRFFNVIDICLNFNQMSQMQGMPTIRVCSPQV